MINNSYKNEKACGSPENVRKRQLSHVLETAPTHATEYKLKRGFAQQSINTNNASAVGQILKKRIQMYCSCSLGTWLLKEHHSMHVMEKVTGNNLTSCIQFSFFHFFCQIGLITLSIFTYSIFGFLCIYQ